MRAIGTRAALARPLRPVLRTDARDLVEAGMTGWLDKLVKILALGLDTRIEPEQRAAMVVAADLAAKHRLSLGSAYLRIERCMPGTFKYLETKRAAVGVASFVSEADASAQPLNAEPLDADLANYPGDRRALAAMLSCTVRPLSRSGRLP